MPVSLAGEVLVPFIRKNGWRVLRKVGDHGNVSGRTSKLPDIGSIHNGSEDLDPAPNYQRCRLHGQPVAVVLR